MKKIRSAIGSLGVAAALCCAGPSRAADSWETFLNDSLATGAGWFNNAKAGVVGKYKKLTGVTFTACFASDWTALVDDPAVTKKWEADTGNKVEFPREKGLLLGSGEILQKWDSDELKCDAVAPDAGVVGFSSAKFDMDQTVMIASSFPVAVIPTEVGEPLLKYLGKNDIHDVTFLDIVNLAGTPWEKIDPSKKHWGDFRVATTDPALSASARTVAISLAYEAAAANKLSGRDITLPAIATALATYRDKVIHTEPSTGALTKAFLLDPNQFHVIFTYESREPQILKEMNADFVFSPYVVQADRRVFVATDDEKLRAAVISYVEFLQGPAVQTIVASDKLALRPSRTDIEIGPVVKGFKKQRFKVVRPTRDVVQAVLAAVTAKSRQ